MLPQQCRLLICDCLVLDVRLNNIVKFEDAFVLSRKNSSFTHISYNWFEYFSTDSSFGVTKLQKLWNNEIRPYVRSTGNFPFPISRNSCENVSSARLFCSWTLIYIIIFNVFTSRHKIEYFRLAFISCAGIDRGITANFAWNLLQAILMRLQVVWCFHSNLALAN